MISVTFTDNSLTLETLYGNLSLALPPDTDRRILEQWARVCESTEEFLEALCLEGVIDPVALPQYIATLSCPPSSSYADFLILAQKDGITVWEETIPETVWYLPLGGGYIIINAALPEQHKAIAGFFALAYHRSKKR